MFKTGKVMLAGAALVALSSWILNGCAAGGATGGSTGGGISGPPGSDDAKGVNGTGAASGSGSKDTRVPAGPP